MKFCDHTLWDNTDPNQITDGIKILADHYLVLHSKNSLSFEKAKIEFCDLKQLANRNYSSFKFTDMFHYFFISSHL